MSFQSLLDNGFINGVWWVYGANCGEYGGTGDIDIGYLARQIAHTGESHRKL